MSQNGAYESMIAEVLKGGEEIKLMDGSRWLVSPFDISVACTWTPTATVIVTEDSDDTAFDYRLHNKGVDVSLQAMRLL